MIRADLHIHSCLSPCGDLEMGPSGVIEEAFKHKLTHIALTDHNTTRNCEAFAVCAKNAGLGFIPGIEVTTVEEAHIVCYFNSLKSAFVFGSIIEDSLFKITLNPEKMGEQIVINSDEEIIGEVDFYLSAASSFSVDIVVEKALELGGFAIAAHVDKPVFSILTQLGFLPELPFSAIEISSGFVRKNGCNHGKIDKNMQIITSSDSHFLHTVGTAGFEIDTDSGDLFGILKELQNKKNDKIKCFTEEIRE